MFRAMITGAYWAARRESKQDASARIASFLSTISLHDPLFSKWFLQARTKSSSLRSQFSLESATVFEAMKSNRRDASGDSMPELGFSLGLWNGGDVAFSARVGAYSSRVGNAVVLSFGGTSQLDDTAWMGLLKALIAAFDPDHAVVTSREYLDRLDEAPPWAAGKLTYERGGLWVPEIRAGRFQKLLPVELK